MMGFCYFFIFYTIFMNHSPSQSKNFQNIYSEAVHVNEEANFPCWLITICHVLCCWMCSLILILELSGRALEELRGSMYNDLRSAEGAKRQQQRLCGPVVAMTFNFLVSVGIILTNKFVSSFCSFQILQMSVEF